MHNQEGGENRAWEPSNMNNELGCAPPHQPQPRPCLIQVPSIMPHSPLLRSSALAIMTHCARRSHHCI